MVRIAGSHPAGPGSIPGNGNLFKTFISASLHLNIDMQFEIHIIGSYSYFGSKPKMIVDEDGIRTHAGRAHWISSPTP